MHRKLAAVLLTTALALTACGGDPEDPAPTAEPGQPDVVSMGIIPIVDVAPLYLGEQQGFFSSRNIELDLAAGQGGAAIIPGVVSGEYQFGFSNVTSLLLAQSSDLGVRVVSNGNNSTGTPGEDFGAVVVRDDSPAQDAADLAGLSVATNTLQNIVPPVVRESVRLAGGDPNAVNFVELPFPEMPAALEAGDVDAVFVVEPFLSATLAAGGRAVAWSFAEAAENLTVAVYFTSTELAESNPDLVQRFTEAMAESLAFADANPDEARAILSSYTQIEADVAEQLTLPRWPAEINRASVEKMAELAVLDGMIPTAPDLDALLP
jgi:NitT/TauT family transport system substrate-binding protein